MNMDYVLTAILTVILAIQVKDLIDRKRAKKGS